MQSDNSYNLDRLDNIYFEAQHYKSNDNETAVDIHRRALKAVAEACTLRGCCGYCSGLGWVETEGEVRATCPWCSGSGKYDEWIDINNILPTRETEYDAEYIVLDEDDNVFSAIWSSLAQCWIGHHQELITGITHYMSLPKTWRITK